MSRDTLEGPEIPLVSRDLSGTEDVKVKQKNWQHVRGWAKVGWAHLPVLPLSRAYWVTWWWTAHTPAYALTRPHGNEDEQLHEEVEQFEDLSCGGASGAEASKVGGVRG